MFRAFQVILDPEKKWCMDFSLFLNIRKQHNNRNNHFFPFMASKICCLRHHLSSDMAGPNYMHSPSSPVLSISPQWLPASIKHLLKLQLLFLSYLFRKPCGLAISSCKCNFQVAISFDHSRQWHTAVLILRLGTPCLSDLSDHKPTTLACLEMSFEYLIRQLENVLKITWLVLKCISAPLWCVHVRDIAYCCHHKRDLVDPEKIVQGNRANPNLTSPNDFSPHHAYLYTPRSSPPFLGVEHPSKLESSNLSYFFPPPLNHSWIALCTSFPGAQYPSWHGASRVYAAYSKYRWDTISRNAFQ